MKVVVNEIPKLEKNYPYLGIAHDGQIVLFESKHYGTVIHPGNDKDEIGKRLTYSDDSCFKPFQGEIVLSNS